MWSYEDVCACGAAGAHRHPTREDESGSKAMMAAMRRRSHPFPGCDFCDGEAWLNFPEIGKLCISCSYGYVALREAGR